MNKTGIEYLDYTWNPTVGCSPVSAGCRECWASIMSKRLKAMGQKDYQLDDPFKPRFLPHRLDEPLKIKKPARIGVSFMGDLFHPDIPLHWIDEIFQVIAESIHTFLILTKRPENMKQYCRIYMQEEVLLPDNLWLGVSVEDQKTANERIPILLQVQAAVRWVSVEPMLEEIYLMSYLDNIDWVVCGAETGAKARPFSVIWARYLRDQCTFYMDKTPFFFKSAGKQKTPDDLKIKKSPKCENYGAGRGQQWRATIRHE